MACDAGNRVVAPERGPAPRPRRESDRLELARVGALVERVRRTGGERRLALGPRAGLSQGSGARQPLAQPAVRRRHARRQRRRRAGIGPAFGPDRDALETVAPRSARARSVRSSVWSPRRSASPSPTRTGPDRQQHPDPGAARPDVESMSGTDRRSGPSGPGRTRAASTSRVPADGLVDGRSARRGSRQRHVRRRERVRPRRGRQRRPASPITVIAGAPA